MTESVASGLDGVVVADTALSEVDGERGRLIIAGHDVEVLGGKRSFEELCRDLWAAIPGATSATELRRSLGRQRGWAFEQLETLGRALFASDAAPTGWTGAHQAEVQPGDVVAVWGAGGVGQMAARKAELMTFADAEGLPPAQPATMGTEA